MRVLFVLSRVPYPLEKGDKLRAFHFIKELSKHHEITLFCISEGKVDPEARSKLKDHCSEVYIHRIPFYHRILRLIGAVFGKRPFQVEYFYSKKAQAKFDDFLEAHIPQHIFCQLIRTAEYTRKYSVIPKTIDYMDAFSAGMARMAQRANFPLSIIMKNEYQRLQRYEKEIAKDFDHHIIISEQDQACIDIDQPIHIIANGISKSFFENRHVPKTRDVLFCGNMSYRPNVESARFLAKDIMPLIWKLNPEIKLTIAGATPAPTIQSLHSNRIEVTGWVDDISEVYQSARVFVAPMLINSGLQNKLLEAMASEVPCVTTSLANNALGAQHNKDVLIGDSKEDIASHVLSLINEPALASRIANKGKEFVLQHNSWEVEVTRLEEIMQIKG